MPGEAYQQWDIAAVVVVGSSGAKEDVLVNLEGVDSGEATHGSIDDVYAPLP